MVYATIAPRMAHDPGTRAKPYLLTDMHPPKTLQPCRLGAVSAQERNTLSSEKISGCIYHRCQVV